MNRQQFVTAGAMASAAGLCTGNSAAQPAMAPERRLRLPKGRGVRVAMVVSPHAAVIDFAGPWEVFNNIALPIGKLNRKGVDAGDASFAPFERSIVSDTKAPVRVSGGLRVVPNYTFATSPQFDVVVVGAQGYSDPAGSAAWLRSQHAGGALVMSVCTGAFTVARSGLFNGLEATTHHDFYDGFEKEFPHVRLVRDVRYVEHPMLASAGGLTSGIDLALRVVQRYYGPVEAKFTAAFMEYTASPARPLIV